MQKWSIEKIWNDTITQQQRPPKIRDYIWAGDIGKSFFDRYLKMSGVAPDMPKDERVLRKLSAGIWFEEQIGHILKTIGILKASQEWIEIPATPETLRVTGKIDFVAGGLTNWGEARERVAAIGFPEFIENVANRLIDHFEKEYPNGLEENLIEVKSVNSQVFWAKKDYLEEAYPHHQMQLYTYLKAKQMPMGRILYISKDDLTVKEMPLFLDSAILEEKWQEDVRTMTKYIRNKVEPPKPEDVVFDPRQTLKFQHEKGRHEIKGCWVENWQVKWSDYFQTITGCATEDEWMDRINPILRDKNEALKDEYKLKLAEGKK